MKRSVVHRKSTPKSRHGCVTCKIRRIKCDERQPSCLRCSKTGRKCDGYPVLTRNSQTKGFKLPDPVTMLNGANNFPGNMLERRSFYFFRSRTVIDIAGHFDSPLWNRLVLQASHSEPAVQYAATALGALHEKVELQRSLGYLGRQTQSIDMDFPVLQYTKALESIRKLLDRSSRQSIEVVLISCLLCIYYELLEENFVAGWTHLDKALKVIMLPRRYPGGSHINNFQGPQGNLLALDEDLIQAFSRLDVQASSYLSRRRPRLSSMIPRNDLPVRFTSLSQSRETLNRIIGQLQHFIWSTASKCRYTYTEIIPQPSITETSRLKLLLKTWYDSFLASLDHLSSTKLTNRDLCGTKILLIQYNVAHIKISTCLYSEESIFDQFGDNFDQILTYAEFVLAHDQNSDPSRVPLSLDMAIIEALFGTAIKCRSHSIRHRAATLLHKVNWKEGVWNASVLAKIADRFIATEEEILETSKDISLRAPEFWRAPTADFTIDWKTRHVKIFCNQQPYVRDERWNRPMDFLTW